MHKIFFGAVILFCISSVYGEFKMNPDENTLWIEDGRNIAVWNSNFGEGFNNTQIQITANPAGGFTMEQRNQGKPRTGRYVPVSPEYPYLVFEISGIEMKNGYRAFWLPILGNGMFTLQGNPQKGLFAVDVYENSKLKKSPGKEFMGLDIHGLKVEFKYIKMVKKPDYYIKVDSSAFADRQYCRVGDKVKFTVFLKEDAEDVSLNFYTNVVLPLKLNGESRLQLMPENENTKKWSAEIELQEIGSPKDVIPLIKAVILGSESAPDALWGKSAYPFQVK